MVTELRNSESREAEILREGGGSKKEDRAGGERASVQKQEALLSDSPPLREGLQEKNTTGEGNRGEPESPPKILLPQKKPMNPKLPLLT